MCVVHTYIDTYIKFTLVGNMKQETGKRKRKKKKKEEKEPNKTNRLIEIDLRDSRATLCVVHEEAD